MRGEKGKKPITLADMPTLEQLEKELNRERFRSRYGDAVRSTIYALITVAAAAVLVATLLLPVLQIYGSSMAPTLEEGEIVVSVKGTDLEQGDVIAFYYNNKILVKRLIGKSGDWIDMDDDGSVSVNGKSLEEPYLMEKSFGECDIIFPYQVPDGRYFVMGDHRSTSVDSRSKAIGCISEEQIVGEIVFRVWPLKSIGII